MRHVHLVGLESVGIPTADPAVAARNRDGCGGYGDRVGFPLGVLGVMEFLHLYYYEPDAFTILVIVVSIVLLIGAAMILGGIQMLHGHRSVLLFGSVGWLLLSALWQVGMLVRLQQFEPTLIVMGVSESIGPALSVVFALQPRVTRWIKEISRPPAARYGPPGQPWPPYRPQWPPAQPPPPEPRWPAEVQGAQPDEQVGSAHHPSWTSHREPKEAARGHLRYWSG